ncbi:MAG: hypothetical protein WBQ32_03825 [Ignavibacteriaceae bacterium]
MMKKRIFILTLTLLFLVSTIGLPVTYHLCEMMKEKSLTECEVCMIEMQKVETSCCNEEMNEEQITISSQNPICCQDEFVYNKIEDEFIFNKFELNSFTSSEISFQTVILIPASIDLEPNISFYCDSSPPFLINPELNITNSVFLI